MPRRQRRTKKVETLRHDEAKRTNIPTAEYSSALEDDDRSPIEVAYARRNRDLDPQLVWRGKDEQDLSDLVVQAPPLYIQEKVHPKVLIDDLTRQRPRPRRGGARHRGLPGGPVLRLQRAAGGRRPHGLLRARRQLVEPHDPRRQPAGDGLARGARGPARVGNARAPLASGQAAPVALSPTAPAHAAPPGALEGTLRAGGDPPARVVAPRTRT